MSKLLEINIDLKEINWRMLYDQFDSSNGFEVIVFGLDNDEDCELLRQVSEALNFDMSFIKYPEGKAFSGSFDENPANIEEFIYFFKGLLEKLMVDHDYYNKINYRYVSKSYLPQKKFNDDLRLLIEFFEYHKKLGASVAWFGMR